MRGSIKIISIRDIAVFIHWTFLFLIGWIIVTSVITGFSTLHFLWTVMLLIAVLISIVLHELGHALVASMYGIYSKSVILLPIGGVASIEKFPDNPKQELAVSIAGPMINLLIAMSISSFLPSSVYFWGEDGFDGVVNSGNFLSYLYVVNLFLAIFNLLPAFPLDGGRILRALLGFKFNYVKATSITSNVTKVVAFVLIVLGIILFHPFIPIAGIFIFFFANTEENYLRFKSLVKGIKVQDVLMYEYNSLDATMKVGEAANVLAYNQSKYFILMDGAYPLGSINRWEIIRAIADMNYDVPLKDLKNKDLKFFQGSLDLEGVLDKMSANEEQIYPVLEKDHFVGVISFQHVLEYLLIHQYKTNDYQRIRSLVGLI